MVRLLRAGLILASSALSQSRRLQIRTVAGEGASHAPDSRSRNPLVVEVTDEIGHPVPGATVSFQLPADGPGGIFETGLRTEIATTDAQGRAAVRNFRVNRSPGAFEIRITAVKDGVRAGMLSRQYVAATGTGRPGVTRSSKKWLVLGGIAAGALGAVMTSGALRGGPGSSDTPPVVSIGAPVEIAIGAP